jgi:hypothetical protein
MIGAADASVLHPAKGKPCSAVNAQVAPCDNFRPFSPQDHILSKQFDAEGLVIRDVGGPRDDVPFPPDEGILQRVFRGALHVLEQSG